MRIATHTASTAVRQTLESLILAAGHSLAPTAAEAELVLRDELHPSTAPLPPCPALALTHHAGEDSLACPLRPQALVARLTLRARTPAIALHHGWSLDGQARSLIHAEQPPLTLTEKECALLSALARAEAPLPREALLAEVWGVDATIDTHTLETHLYRLRSKLAELTPPPGDIITTQGAYLLASPTHPG